MASRPQVRGQRSPGAALAAVAADGLAVAVALLDDHADVRLHELGDVHDLRARRGATVKLYGSTLERPGASEVTNQPSASRTAAPGPPR